MTAPERHGLRPAEDSAGNSWTVRPCSAEPGRLSEGPRWDGDRNELLWVDVLAAGPDFVHVDDAGAVRELAQPEAGRTDVRMNDGACDPQGRFWAGTMAHDEAPG